MVILAVATTTTGSSVNARQLVPDKDCLFTHSLDKCKPDSSRKCPGGFSLNINSQCIPNKCPKGFVKHDNDETGK
ncbi:MAG TPA: hypothetical protein VH796_17870 [Nitrososphaeraceae archaeon]|jgi:hypothetical protein